MNQQPTKLLVSVRNRDEAIAALEGGADLIDVKEPRHGSLGAADQQTIDEVVHAVAGKRPVSTALGELNDLPPTTAPIPLGLSFFKIGLAGCLSDATWPDRWIAACRELGKNFACPVAVAYADWETAKAPPPEEILRHSEAARATMVLVDTFDKSLPGLTGLWTMDRIAGLVSQVHALSMKIVLAGKLSMDDAVKLKATGADYLAVRSAVCRPDRSGPLDGQLVRDLAERLR